MENAMQSTDRARRVLIIDDRPGIRLVFRDFLEVLGYASDAAVDGEDGLSMLAAAPDAYGLVVTDMKMPGMTGLDVAMRVRDLAPATDVVIVSGSTIPEEAERIESLGFSYIPKPVTLRAFTVAVERAFSLDHAVAELAGRR
jgi:CheY-like chemotaxis protein